VIVAALLVVPVIIVEATPSIDRPWTTIAEAVNWTIWLVFAAELVAYLAVVRGRGRWLREHPLEVAIVVLTPPFLPSSLQAIRALRLLRLLRLFRLAKIGRQLFSTQGLRYAALLALLTALGGGAAFASVEKGHSTWDGVWWSVTTMTTVGYGDLYPTTTEGRFLAIVVMLVGIGFIAILTGAVAQRFLAADVMTLERDVATEAESIEAILDEFRAVRERLIDLEQRVHTLARIPSTLERPSKVGAGTPSRQLELVRPQIEGASVPRAAERDRVAVDGGQPERPTRRLRRERARAGVVRDPDGVVDPGDAQLATRGLAGRVPRVDVDGVLAAAAEIHVRDVELLVRERHRHSAERALRAEAAGLVDRGCGGGSLASPAAAARQQDNDGSGERASPESPLRAVHVLHTILLRYGIDDCGIRFSNSRRPSSGDRPQLCAISLPLGSRQSSPSLY
jgi:voltage-gated potassium channel